MQQVRFKITGKVQGVFFRAHAREQAQKLNLKGIIQNMPDGSVEATLQGEPEALENFKEWCAKGSPTSTPEHVETQIQKPETSFTDIEIS